MIDIAWILLHAETVKDVIAAAISDETQEDVSAFIENIKDGVGILLDILQEPAQEIWKDIDLTSRSIPDPRTETVLETLEEIEANE